MDMPQLPELVVVRSLKLGLLDVGHLAATHRAARCCIMELMKALPQDKKPWKPWLGSHVYRDYCRGAKPPLHSCLERHAPVEVVQALLKARPQDASCAWGHDKEYGRGVDKLPIHIALEQHASSEVILSLLDMHPDAIKKNVYDRNGIGYRPGSLLLHLAVQCHPALEVVRKLLMACPEAAWTKDQYGTLPLHNAVCGGLFGASLEVVQILLDMYPEAARTKYQHAFPLHIAVKSRAPLEIVQRLIDAYPQALQERCRPDNGSRYDRLPLHVALVDLVHGGSPKMAQMLLAAFPRAAAEKDSCHGYPLHIAKQCGAPNGRACPQELVQALLEAHPAAA